MNIAMLSIIIHVYLLLWFCYFAGKKLCGGYSIIKNHFLSNGFWFPGSISKLTRPVNSERHPDVADIFFVTGLWPFWETTQMLLMSVFWHGFDLCFCHNASVNQSFCQSKLLAIIRLLSIEQSLAIEPSISLMAPLSNAKTNVTRCGSLSGFLFVYPIKAQ